MTTIEIPDDPSRRDGNGEYEEAPIKVRIFEAPKHAIVVRLTEAQAQRLVQSLEERINERVKARVEAGEEPAEGSGWNWVQAYDWAANQHGDTFWALADGLITCEEADAR